MNKLEAFSENNRFSHIYYESEALEYPLTQLVFDRFPKAVRVEVNSYKEVFCRPGQDLRLQKRHQALLLAAKKGSLIYKGPEICQNFGNERFFYMSPALNCVYDCEYCYLQGMYQTAYLTLFVNIDDYFKQVVDELKNGPMYLTISYDTDLLAVEGLFSMASRWIEFSREQDGLLAEIRTKSANYNSIKHMQPTGNVTLAWTLSPHEIVSQYEFGAPSLFSRLNAIKAAQADGWKIRLCLDPLLAVNNWREVYSKFIRQVFEELEPYTITDISAGAFRMPQDYYKKIKKQRIDSELYSHAFEYRQGMACYPEKLENELTDFVVNKLSDYFPRNRIWIYNS